MPEASLATSIISETSKPKKKFYTRIIWNGLFCFSFFGIFFIFMCVCATCTCSMYACASCACSVFDLHPMPAFYISMHHIREAYLSVYHVPAVYMCFMCIKCVCLHHVHAVLSEVRRRHCISWNWSPENRTHVIFKSNQCSESLNHLASLLPFWMIFISSLPFSFE